MKTLLVLMLSMASLQALSAKHLPAVIEHNNKPFQQCKDYTLRYGLLIKVAEIGWYSPDCTQQKNVLASGNKVIRFHYLVNVSGDFFKKSAQEYFLLNLENQEQQKQFNDVLTAFNSGYKDIKDGEYFDLVHIDDASLSLFKNNELLSVTKNSLFSRKYFNIWFGNIPVIDKLKLAFSKPN